MKTPIYKIIGHTEEDYNELVFKMMLTWANLYSGGSFANMQTLIANRKINNWFHAEFKKLIAQFRMDLEESESRYKTTCKDRCQLFMVTTTKILDVYPKVLMMQVTITDQKAIETKKFSNN
jgi:hypothetical protein